jgi:NADH:ubiquinone reductase (H+-translocating)
MGSERRATGPRPHVVIVGGGFAGLYAARALGGQPVDVTVVDQHNYHLFQPLLYQVATAGLSPGDIAQPIRGVLRGSPNVRVLLAEAVSVDLEGRRLVLSDGDLRYDYLLLAAGASHAYFGHDDWRPYAPGLKDLDDALEIRRRVLGAFEAAERETDATRRRAWLTFVIVGGGPTGVELAGTLAEIARHALRQDFRAIDPGHAYVLLLEAGPRILAGFAPDLSAAAARQLALLGVEVRTGATVTRIVSGHVEVGAARIEAQTVLWAAGVTAAPLARTLGVPLDRAGRVQVLPDLSIPGHPEVFAAGDLATVAGPDGSPLPGMAPVAIQMGRHVAAAILRAVRGEERRPFRYRDKGIMATIGRHAAVAQVGRLHLTGTLAWLAWLAVHLVFLIGFRNRLLVLIEWAWAYVTYNRGVRLITGPGGPPRRPG